MTRNPNYLGEIFIYNSFAIIANGWEFWIILSVAYFVIFGGRMIIKEYSLMKKPGWNEYDSYMLLPKFSSSWSDNLIIYGFIIGMIYFIHSLGGISSSISILKQSNCSELASSFYSLLQNSYFWNQVINSKVYIQRIIQSYM